MSKSSVNRIKSVSTLIKNEINFLCTFFNFFFFAYYPCIYLSCLLGGPFEKPQKQSKSRLSGIRCSRSPVFFQVFGVKIECECKGTFTVVSQRRKNRKIQKKSPFFAYFPCINTCLSGRPFEKPQNGQKQVCWVLNAVSRFCFV